MVDDGGGPGCGDGGSTRRLVGARGARLWAASAPLREQQQRAGLLRHRWARAGCARAQRAGRWEVGDRRAGGTKWQWGCGAVRKTMAVARVSQNGRGKVFK